MTRMRMAALASGLAALLLGPAFAGAQDTGSMGGDRYGGATLNEDTTTEDTAGTQDRQDVAGQDQGQTDDTQSTGETPSGQDADINTGGVYTPAEENQREPTRGVEDQGNTDLDDDTAEPSATPDATATPPAPTDDTDVNVNVAPPPAPVNLNIEEEDDDDRTPLGVAFSVGGGVNQFADDDVQDLTQLGGQFEARLSLGTRSLLGLEAAYVGTASDIEALGLDDDAFLVSNGVEGLARLNLGTFDFQPYVVGGASWVRYNVVNEDFNTSSVRNEDDVLALPFGGGFSSYIGDSGLVFDARFIYRATYNNDLLAPGTGNELNEDLDNYSATLRLGYEF